MYLQNRKAQILSIDAVVAFLVFAIFVGFALNTAIGLEVDAANAQEVRDMQKRVLQISDILVTTPGVPAYWHVQEASERSIGLAWKDHVLADEKLVALNDTSKIQVNTLRRLLGVGRYNATITLLNATNTDQNCPINGGNISAGNTLTSQTQTVIEIRINRVVRTEDGRTCKLQVNVWRQ